MINSKQYHTLLGTSPVQLRFLIFNPKAKKLSYENVYSSSYTVLSILRYSAVFYITVNQILYFNVIACSVVKCSAAMCTLAAVEQKPN